MHIMPRWHIETIPSTSSYFVTPEGSMFDLDSSSVVRSLIGLFIFRCKPVQGSKIALVRSCLRVPQAAGQVKILILLVKIKFFPMFTNIFCDAGQVPISRYFEACGIQFSRKAFSFLEAI